jgi:cysteinyl-tRNA synthetase
MYIYDSLKQKKIKLESLDNNKLSIYSCGPTVYDDAHLGHARNSIVFDLLFRILKYLDYEVLMIKNYTDIDDKIIKKAKEQNKSIADICEYYIQRYENDMKQINIINDGVIKPKATKYIYKMIDFINELLKNNLAYIKSDAIYFDSKKDNLYGSISKRLQEDGISRIEVRDKKNSQDFAIWKFEDDESISYKASFGRGRPGWHTECCSIIDDLSEKGVDIHCGGSDLLFPHHENEATQFRSLRNHEIARYWMHNGFVKINNEKMSKSLGNSFFLKDFFPYYHGEVIRYYLMAIHYRMDFNFSDSGLKDAKIFIDKIYRLKQKVLNIPKKNINKQFDNIIDALKDDLNISKAIACINEYISFYNEKLVNEPKNKQIKQEVLYLLDIIVNVFGISYENPYSYFQFGLSKEEIEKINTLIHNRKLAREEKNFELSDEIKKELIKQNIKIMDMANGETMWEKDTE